MTPVGSRVDPELYCKYATLRQISCPNGCSAIDIQIRGINFDDLRNGVQVRLIDIFGDIFCDRGRCQNNRGRRIGKDRGYPLMNGAAVGQKERNCDEPGLHGAEERRD
jgi:hypothetical protein